MLQVWCHYAVCDKRNYVVFRFAVTGSTAVMFTWKGSIYLKRSTTRETNRIVKVTFKFHIRTEFHTVQCGRSDVDRSLYLCKHTYWSDPSHSSVSACKYVPIKLINQNTNQNTFHCSASYMHHVDSWSSLHSTKYEIIESFPFDTYLFSLQRYWNVLLTRGVLEYY